MSDYRLYFLDNNDHVQRAVEILCDGDRTAMRLAEERAGRHERFELWQRARKVKAWDLRPEGSAASH